MTFPAITLLLCVTFLGQNGDKIEKLPWAFKMVNSKNEYHVYASVQVIVAEDKQAVTTLLNALQNQSAQLQPAIIGGLGDLSTRAKPAVSILHEFLKGKNSNTRCAAIYALGKIDSPKFTPEFATMYERETDKKTRNCLLAAMSPISLQVKEVMKAALNEKHPDEEAVRLASRFGTEAQVSLPRIIEITQQKYIWNQTRVEAIKAIGAIDPHSPAAIETLEKLADHEDVDLQSTALEVLALSQHPLATEIIKRHLSDEYSSIRVSAICSLGKRKEATAVADLQRMLKQDENLSVRSAIVKAFWNIEGSASETAERNLEIMREAKRQERKENTLSEVDLTLENAVQLVGEVGEAAANSVPLLRVLLGDHCNFIRMASIQSLQAIGEPAFEAIPNLKYVARFDSSLEIPKAAQECIEVLEKQQSAKVDLK